MPDQDPAGGRSSDRGAAVASGLGPVQIGGRLGMQASTVHAVLVRCRINRLCHIDRVTGEPLHRYEHKHPGSLIHVDSQAGSTSTITTVPTPPSQASRRSPDWQTSLDITTRLGL